MCYHCTMSTRDQLRPLFEAGLSYSEIVRRTGCAKSTVAYHARRLGQPFNSSANNRYDWREIQGYHDTGRSLQECIDRFGFSPASWSKAIREGRLVSNTPYGQDKLTLEQVMERGRAPYNLKRRLIKSGMLRDHCYICGINTWLDKPLVLHLDHINGDGDDHRYDNLRLLCPNCHSQTDTYCGRNKLKKLSPVV